MLKPQIHQSQSIKNLLAFPNPLLHGTCPTFLPVINSRSSTLLKNKTRKTVRLGFVPSSNIKAATNTSDEKAAVIGVKAVVTVKETVSSFLKTIGVGRGLDDIKDLLGKTLLLELVSAELVPSK